MGQKQQNNKKLVNNQKYKKGKFLTNNQSLHVNDNLKYIEEKTLRNVPVSISTENLKIILEQSEKCICKIEINKGKYGTGFFCAIPFPNKYHLLPVLITNNHVLSEDDIIKGKQIKFTLNNDNYQFEIKIDGSRRTYTSIKYDITIIEIKDNDNLDINTFLEIDQHIFDKKAKDIYKNKSVYIIHYPQGLNSEYSIGLIKSITQDNYNIIHTCQTNHGSSGCPIININGNRVIGIHKGYDEDINKNYNYGTFIREPIEHFYNSYNNVVNNINNIEISEDKNNKYKFNNKLIENDLIDNNNIVEKIIHFEENNNNKYKVVIDGKEYNFCCKYQNEKIKFNIYKGENKNITLISSDGIKEEISKKAAFRSELIINIYKINSKIIEIPLALKTEVLKKIKEYLEYYEDKEPKEIENPLPSNNLRKHVDEWDFNYIDLELDNIFDIILGANYLSIKSLAELASAKLASIMIGKTTEQLRLLFNIKKDITPEEEKKIKEENEWWCI